MRLSPILIIALCCFIAISGLALAQSSLDVVFSTLHAGGTSTAGGYSLSGVVGQATTSESVGERYTLTSGYLSSSISGSRNDLYLPLVER